MSFEEKIKELKIVLPEAKAPVGSYIAAKKVGNLLFISGQISINSNGELIKGKIGKDGFAFFGYENASSDFINLPPYIAHVSAMFGSHRVSYGQGESPTFLPPPSGGSSMLGGYKTGNPAACQQSIVIDIGFTPGAVALQEKVEVTLYLVGVLIFVDEDELKLLLVV